MNWVEEWAKFEVIGKWVGLGILALAALALIVYVIVINVQWAYKKHSKKYAWDCVRGKYVKKEDFEK